MAGIGFNSFNNPYAKTTLKANVNAPLAKTASNQPTVQKAKYNGKGAAEALKNGTLKVRDTIGSCTVTRIEGNFVEVRLPNGEKKWISAQALEGGALG